MMENIKMSTTILEHIKGSEFPDSWKKKLEAKPDQTFTVTIKPDQEDTTPIKSRWAQVAERISKENYLKGRSEEVVKHVREFRNNFSFKND